MAKEACLASEQMHFTNSDPTLVGHSMATDSVTIHYPLIRVLSGGVGGSTVGVGGVHGGSGRADIHLGSGRGESNLHK